MKLSKAHGRLLRAIATLSVATQVQLARELGISKSHVSEGLAVLGTQKLIDIYKDFRPNYYRLTRSGSRVAGVNFTRHFRSHSAMSNVLHRNDAVDKLRAPDRTVKVIPRVALYKAGLYPGIGEWGLLLNDNAIALLLVDDYAMRPSRIAHTWIREHNPTEDFYTDEQKMRWADRASRYFVFTTSEYSQKQHRKFLDKKHPNLAVDIDNIPNLFNAFGETYA